MKTIIAFVCLFGLSLAAEEILSRKLRQVFDPLFHPVNPFGSGHGLPPPLHHPPAFNNYIHQPQYSDHHLFSSSRYPNQITQGAHSLALGTNSNGMITSSGGPSNQTPSAQGLPSSSVLSSSQSGSQQPNNPSVGQQQPHTFLTFGAQGSVANSNNNAVNSQSAGNQQTSPTFSQLRGIPNGGNYNFGYFHKK